MTVINRPWRQAVRSAAGRPEGWFGVCAKAVTAPFCKRPLLVIVHPGDAIEDGIGYEGEERQQVIAFGRANTLGMADEINARMVDHDVVIIHRQSSLDTFMRTDFAQFRRAEQEIRPYTKACIKASETGTVLWGDDLEAVSAWMIAALFPQQRPVIFMTGAYADANDGCITAIGKLLQQAGCREIEVSSFAPTDNCNYSPRWEPKAINCPIENTMQAIWVIAQTPGCAL